MQLPTHKLQISLKSERRGRGLFSGLIRALTHDSYLFYNRLIFAQPWTLPARTCAEANLPPPTCVFPFLYFALPHFLLTFQLRLSTGTSNESKLHSTEKNNLLHLQLLNWLLMIWFIWDYEELQWLGCMSAALKSLFWSFFSDLPGLNSAEPEAGLECV